MSDFTLREGTGTLFRNDRAENERHPSHKGTVLLNGVTYEIAAWVKEGRRGRFFSLKIEPQGAQQPRQEAAQPASAAEVGQGAPHGLGLPYQPRKRTTGEYPTPQAGRGGLRKPITDDPIPF